MAECLWSQKKRRPVSLRFHELNEDGDYQL
jgi:hypothetical protein